MESIVPVDVRWIKDSSAEESSPCSVMLCSLFHAARMWTLTKTRSSSLAAILMDYSSEGELDEEPGRTE